jgi:hypothetical protein
VGVPLLAVLASCTNEPVFVPVVDGTFVVPVAEFDPALDAALWDDTVYDSIVVKTVVAQVTAVPSVARLPRPLGALFASLGAVVPSSCIPLVSFADADADGIPASYDATFNCLGVPAGTARVTGRVAITDTNDASPTGGLTVTFSSFVIAIGTTSGAVVARTLNGKISLAPTLGGKFFVQQDLTTTFPSADPSTPQLLDVYVSKETATYTPDAGTTDPFSSGTANLDGDGQFTATFNGDQKTKDIARSTNPNLHWNRSCRTQFHGSSGYDSGTLIYDIDGPGKLALLFSGCVTPTQVTNQH